MTQVMQAAIERLQALPDTDQEDIAARILAYLARLEDLRAAMQDGLDSGPATPWDKDDFLKQAHARLDEQKKSTD